MSLSHIEPTPRAVSIGHLVSLGENATAANILRRAFYEAWLSGDQPSLRSVLIERSVAVAPTLPSHLLIDRSSVDGSGAKIVARGPGSTVMVEVDGDSSFVRVTARTDGEADALIRELVDLWGSGPPPSSVDLQLWHGGTCCKRRIIAPAWSEVSRNYPPRTRSQLDRLMRAIKPTGKGKLVLWHGQPGTGKTSAIRALAHAWASWCGMQYISDPEKLFGDPDYLIRMLGLAPDPRSQATLNTAGDPDKAWQLIVAEDTDDYLQSSNGQHAGGSLGRILNLTDGLLGQSFNALILLTTNEDVTRLHPALVRPGRCLARVPFERFTRSEAGDWLDGSGTYARSSMTLAELLLAAGDLEINDSDIGEAFAHTGMYL